MRGATVFMSVEVAAGGLSIDDLVQMQTRIFDEFNKVLFYMYGVQLCFSGGEKL